MFIRSERLFLRPAWPEDRAEIHQVLGADVRFGAASPRHPQFLITLPDHRGAHVVGKICLAARDGLSELGVWIGRDWQGRGFATEAARAALTLARTLGHCRLFATPLAGCAASDRVLARLGFVPTGQVRLNPAREVHVLDLCSPVSDPANPEMMQRAA